MEEFLIISLGTKERFAVPLSKVARVVHGFEVTTMPGTPRGLKGMTSIDGSLYGVIDLTETFDIQSATEPKHGLLVEMEHKCVLEVCAVETIVAALPRPIPDNDTVEAGFHLEGSPIFILNLEKIRRRFF